MGWFSTKEQITVALQFVQLAENPDPKTLMNTVIGSILQEVGVSRAIKEEMSRGFYSKVMAAYRYGLSGFTGGLPESTLLNFQLTNPDVLVVLNRVVGAGPKTIRSYSVSKLNPSVIAHKYLAATYGWISATNTYPASNKKLSATDYKTNDPTQIYIEWEEDVSGNIVKTFEYCPNPYTVNNNHLIVEYCTTANASETDVSFMILEDLTLGLHPELDNEEIPANQYFPIIPLRLNKVNIDANLPSVKYNTTTKLLGKIGLDMSRIMSSIMSTEEDNNPDQVDSVFVTFSINITADNKACNEYLARYFYSMRNGSVTKAIFDNHVQYEYGPAPYNGVIIREGSFNVILSWNYIEVLEYTGSFNFMKSGEVLKIYFYGGDKYTLKSGEHYNASSFVFVHQYAKDKYRRITVHGLEQGVDIYQGNYVVSSLDTAYTVNDQSKGLYIPVMKNVLDDMHPMRKNDVAQSSLTMVVYAVSIQYIKWYQRSKLLKKIAMVITIVVSIIYPPAGAAAATITALLVNTIINIVIQIIIAKLIIKAAYYVGKMVGGDLAAILAVIATVAAIVYSPGSLPQATSLLNAATGLNLAYGADLDKKMAKLKAGEGQFLKELDLKKDSIQAQLDTFASVSTLDTLKSSIGLLAPYESSDDYYRRTLFNTDMTEAVFAMVSAYHDIALTLPVTIEGR